MEIEKAFRTLKSTLNLRPVYHRKDEKIKALIQGMHLVEIQTKDGRILQRTELTPEQSNILKKLNISPPPKVYKAEPRA